jgi:hypothetical protein
MSRYRHFVTLHYMLYVMVFDKLLHGGQRSLALPRKRPTVDPAQHIHQR